MTPPSGRTLNREPQPPIGVISALVGGFETVNKQLLLALLPLLLDLFLWLGPQLSIKPLADDAGRQLQEMAAGAPTDSLAAQLAGQWQQIGTQADGVNLFGLLSTAPLGLPSVMARRIAVVDATHVLGVWGVTNGLVYVFLLVVLPVLGVFAGALYFGGIAQQVRDGRIDWLALAGRVWLDWAQLLGFGLAALLVTLLLGVPAVALALLLTALNQVIGSAALALAFSLVFWLMVFGVFGPHGITLSKRNLFAAIWDSLRLVRVSLAPTVGLVTAVILLYFGLGAIWTLAPVNSWLNVIGIAAHAVVSTALVAATFVYYQDRVRWWRETLATRMARLRA
ncbi:MAG: hypothetical protein JNL73_22075 [Anaerolineales bacterium]|nr:hypothetical protein [Anaerolineales bacterium]